MVVILLKAGLGFAVLWLSLTVISTYILLYLNALNDAGVRDNWIFHPVLLTLLVVPERWGRKIAIPIYNFIGFCRIFWLPDYFRDKK